MCGGGFKGCRVGSALSLSLRPPEVLDSHEIFDTVKCGKEGNFAIQMLKSFQLQETSPAWLPYQGPCPWTLLRAPPQTPVAPPGPFSLIPGSGPMTHAAVLVQLSIFITYFTCTHLLLAGNDTVPMSVWRGEVRAVPSAVSYRRFVCLSVCLSVSNFAQKLLSRFA